MNKEMLKIISELKECIEAGDMHVVNVKKMLDDMDTQQKVTSKVQEHCADEIEKHLSHAINEPVLKNVIKSYVLASICTLFNEGKIIFKKEGKLDEKKTS